jgi:hypothetical protein
MLICLRYFQCPWKTAADQLEKIYQYPDQSRERCHVTRSGAAGAGVLSPDTSGMATVGKITYIKSLVNELKENISRNVVFSTWNPTFARADNGENKVGAQRTIYPYWVTKR